MPIIIVVDTAMLLNQHYLVMSGGGVTDWKENVSGVIAAGVQRELRTEHLPSMYLNNHVTMVSTNLHPLSLTN
jgi:hypothetical protein